LSSESAVSLPVTDDVPVATPEDLLRRLPYFDEQKFEDYVRTLDRSDVERFAGDPWVYNYVLNMWEYVNGKAVLESYPWRIYLPIADSCNARCEFCTSWLSDSNYITPDQVDALAPVLKRAVFIDLCGYGEPLSNPHFEDVIDRIDHYIDPRCQLALFSNGALLERWLDRLLAMGVNTFNISLNAATAETHDKVMGLGPKAFDRVVHVLELLAQRAQNVLTWVDGQPTGGKPIYVSASMVPTSNNIHEAAAFVELCDRLKLTSAYVRVLQYNAELIPGLNYHLLPPTLNPDFEAHRAATVDAIAKASIPIYASPENWDLPILPETVTRETAENPPPVMTRAQSLEFSRTWPEPVHIDREPEWQGTEPNPFNRQPRFDCTYVYRNFLLNRKQFFVTPCCYMRSVPGHDPVYYDGSKDFFETWNAPAFTELRRSLAEGPLMHHCKVCPLQK
jgi:pyruvate-formate lyase-activating enzyme